MKLPRDLGGDALARALRRFGYEVSRQTGSHLRLTTLEGDEMLAGILRDVAGHLGLTRDELARRQFE